MFRVVKNVNGYPHEFPHQADIRARDSHHEIWFKFSDKENIIPKRLSGFAYNTIIEYISPDDRTIEQRIIKDLEERGNLGLVVSSLKNNFFQMRGHPVVENPSRIENCLKNLCSNGDILLRSVDGRDRYEEQVTVQDGMTAFHKNHIELPEYKCELCREIFRNQRKLEDHKMNEHVKCSKCGEYFLDEEELQEHSNEEHTYPCSICNDSFETEELLQAHLKEHQPKQICPKCRKSFETPEDLETHISSAHKEPVEPPIIQTIGCEFCHKNFTSANDLDRHIKQEHNFVCEICKKMFTEKSKLEEHLSTAHVEEESADKHQTTTITIPETTSLASLLGKIESVVQLADTVEEFSLEVILDVAEAKGILIPDNEKSQIDGEIKIIYSLKTSASVQNILVYVKKFPLNKKGRFTLSMVVRNE
ncbi:MAG: C2H2-type zinc finger protein [Candidatus Odinarchaeota archaeon]